MKSPLVKAAVWENFSVLQQHSLFQNLNLKKGYGVLVALGLSFVLIAGVFFLTGQGDLGILQQRLFGQVHLSSGTFSAQSVTALNQLSWGNGLDIMESLDTVNEDLDSLKNLRPSVPEDHAAIQRTMQSLQHTEARLNALLQDKKVLLKTARVLKTRTLYAPVYEGYLLETQTKLRQYHLAEQTSPRLVQK